VRTLLAEFAPEGPARAPDSAQRAQEAPQFPLSPERDVGAAPQMLHEPLSGLSTLVRIQLLDTI
jgi:hypothetical protein